MTLPKQAHRPYVGADEVINDGNASEAGFVGAEEVSVPGLSGRTAGCGGAAELPG